jgi:hypothetical protein
MSLGNMRQHGVRSVVASCEACPALAPFLPTP